MTLHLSDFTFIPDSTSPEALSRGDGAVLIPAGVVSDDSRAFEVVDRQGRQVVFDGGGQLFFSDSEAGTEELVGRSYWETDETDDNDDAAGCERGRSVGGSDGRARGRVCRPEHRHPGSG